MKPLIQSLVKIRKQRKLTQQHVANRMKIPQGHISSIETEKVDPRLSTFCDFAYFIDAIPVLVPREKIMEVRAILNDDPKNKKLIQIIEE